MHIQTLTLPLTTSNKHKHTILTYLTIKKMATATLNNPKRTTKGYFNLNINNPTLCIYSSDFAKNNNQKDKMYFTYSINGIPCYFVINWNWLD